MIMSRNLIYIGNKTHWKDKLIITNNETGIKQEIFLKSFTDYTFLLIKLYKSNHNFHKKKITLHGKNKLRGEENMGGNFQ